MWGRGGSEEGRTDSSCHIVPIGQLLAQSDPDLKLTDDGDCGRMIGLLLYL